MYAGDVFVLGKQDLMEVMQFYPQSAQQIHEVNSLASFRVFNFDSDLFSFISQRAQQKFEEQEAKKREKEAAELKQRETLALLNEARSVLQVMKEGGDFAVRLVHSQIANKLIFACNRILS